MIGIDMEHVSRFNDWTKEGLKRVFTEKEIEYASGFTNSSEHFCGFFCVKEALVKALDNDGISYCQIEIAHTESGKPYVVLTKYLSQILKEHFFNRIEVSISHCRDMATAVVLVE